MQYSFKNKLFTAIFFASPLIAMGNKTMPTLADYEACKSGNCHVEFWESPGVTSSDNQEARKHLIPDLEKVAAQFELRYAKLLELWSNTPRSQEDLNHIYEKSRARCSEEAVALLDNIPDLFEIIDRAADIALQESKDIRSFLKHMKDNQIYAFRFLRLLPRQFATRFFRDMMNLFEQLHNLRIEMSRVLIKLNPPCQERLARKVMIDEFSEGYMQGYAKAVFADIKVAPWFQRMRRNDI